MHRVEKDGSDFVFPEAFQLEVNDAEYINNNLQVCVDLQIANFYAECGG